MTYRIRVKRPKWEDITAEEPLFGFVTVTNLDGGDLKVFDVHGDYGYPTIDVLHALANIKHTAGESLPDMNSLYIKGLNAQDSSDQINLSLYPDYEDYSNLCLYCTIGGDRYCFGLSNNSANCY